MELPRPTSPAGDGLARPRCVASLGNVAAARDADTEPPDYYTADVSRDVQATIERYGQQDPPDPAVLYLPSNEVAYDSNLYVLHRNVEGEFRVDIFFEEAGRPSPLDGP